jgi:replicative DNA helicase
VVVTGSEEEAAVIGAILTDGGCYQEAAAIIEEKDFYDERHRLIWRAMTSLTEKGDRIDLVSVCAKLKQKKALMSAGGSSGVSALTDTLFDVQNIAYYAKEVKSASIGRDLKRIGRNLMQDAIKPESRMDIAFGALSDLNRRAVLSKEVMVGDVSKSIMSDVLSGNGFTEGVPMGFLELDEPLSGLNKESLIILAARPSIGKSAFSLQVAANVAKRNVPVLYISPEMSKLQLTKRLLSMQSGVPYSSIMSRKKLSDSDMKDLKEADDKIRTIPLVIDDSSEQTITDVRLKARRMQATGGLGLVIIDYLQLLCEGDDSKENVTKISKGLKSIAKDLCIPVWAVSQLSRSIVYRDSQRPTLSDLRGSGQIEQDADVCMFLWFPKKKDPEKIEIFIEKHRNGPLGQTTLHFDKATTKFTTGEW